MSQMKLLGFGAWQL